MTIPTAVPMTIASASHDDLPRDDLYKPVEMRISAYAAHPIPGDH
jgi:hypothetical protein